MSVVYDDSGTMFCCHLNGSLGMVRLDGDWNGVTIVCGAFPLGVCMYMLDVCVTVIHQPKWRGYNIVVLSLGFSFGILSSSALRECG